MPRFRLLLRQLRQSQELSQEELARALQVSRQSIISLERGEYLPSAPVLIALMEFFNCSLPELIEGVNIRAVSQPTPSAPEEAGAVNISETETYFEVEAFVPGFSEEEITIEMRDNTLIIRAEQAEVSDVTADKNTVRQEWVQQPFNRSIRFQVPIAETAIEAKLQNGILTIAVPKAAPQEPKTTRIQVKRS